MSYSYGRNNEKKEKGEEEYLIGHAKELERSKAKRVAWERFKKTKEYKLEQRAIAFQQKKERLGKSLKGYAMQRAMFVTSPRPPRVSGSIRRGIRKRNGMFG